jgi:indole-3-glycerol phosphate synthase
LATLVEVHDERELDRALAAGADIIGVNNRDLKDFSVNLGTTEKLSARLKRGMCAKYTLVAESGIHTRADVERLADSGVDAILVGESLMRSGDVAAKVKELMG